MSPRPRAIRGMHDILPSETPVWGHIEARLRALMEGYGYAEIRMPILEQTDLFKRSIGEVTDIVEKEMYSFQDRNGDGLTLRPEGTAGCVRACIEHGLLDRPQRLWYQGPMFRHERPQKGRYRQFHQFGVEAFGLPGPDIDLELILLSARLWRELGLQGLELQLNSLGRAEERAVYRERLVAYLQAHATDLDADSRRRLHSNPLRVLDSKNPALADILGGAPRLLDHLGGESRAHFDALCAGLDACGVSYRIEPRLVRGLDYYGLTVFEWVTDRLGAQGTVCAGGRYDGLVAQLGGRPTPAVGFALGLERLVALVREQGLEPPPAAPHLYLVAVGGAAQAQAPRIAESLRDRLPGLRLQVHCGGGGFKSQFKKADRSGAAHALILGEDELERGVAGLKPLRAEGEQIQVPLEDLPAWLRERILGR